MSIENALLARARPYMLAAKTRSVLQEEICKGCLPDLSPYPVALEPPFRPLLSSEPLPAEAGSAHWDAECPTAEDQLVRLQIWISPEQQCDWNHSESFLKQLSYVHGRVAFEIVGNHACTVISLLCNRADVGVVSTAFQGQFDLCELTVAEDEPLSRLPTTAWDSAAFLDFFPPPPYSHLITRPDELKRSPYSALVAALARLLPPALGFYQVVFAPVSPDHDWHQNVRTLLDMEFSVKLLSGFQRFAQQTPSGDLRHMAVDVETKSHNDKPFFASALRIGVAGAGERSADLLRSLSVIGSLFQHGGRPLNWLDQGAYRGRLSSEQLRALFLAGLTYRPGFLVNSSELASLVHIPSPGIAEQRGARIVTLETLPPTEALSVGTPIGYCSYAGKSLPVCIPPEARLTHVHLVGKPRQGKSTVMERMVLDDVSHGHGVAVLDPHGSLVQRLLMLLPREHADRVIYIDPGDPHWVPIWNPLRCSSGLSPDRIADDLVSAFKSFVSGWGHRLEHLLRHAIYAVLHLPRGTLLDVSDLLRSKSEESRQLRSLVLRLVDNESAISHWRQDFDRYGRADLAPAQHKLSKLLTAGTVSLMLSQGDSLFDLRDVMDSGKILLVDLSTIGSEARETLGCLLLSLLHMTALGRGAAPGVARRPFHTYCDEAHRFLTDAIDDLIAETAKFKVSLTLAHQYMSQFAIKTSDAISSVGSTIIFNVDTRDAQYLRKDLQGLVEVEDLATLGVGQAIARIGTQVVRLKAYPPLEIPADNCRDLIIAQSRARYYRPIAEVRRAVHARRERWREPLASGSGCSTESAGSATGSFGGHDGGGAGGAENYGYDEF